MLIHMHTKGYRYLSFSESYVLMLKLIDAFAMYILHPRDFELLLATMSTQSFQFLCCSFLRILLRNHFSVYDINSHLIYRKIRLYIKNKLCMPHYTPVILFYFFVGTSNISKMCLKITE